MSFQQFESITGKLQGLSTLDPSVPINVKYGMNYKVKYNIRSNGETFGKRPSAYFSNLVTITGKVVCNKVRDVNVFDGFNAAVMGIDGSVSRDLVAKMLAGLWDVDKKLNTSRVHAIVHNNYDNVTPMLYNMLRMYYIKLLQESDKPKIIQAGARFYDDGHISVTNGKVLNIFRDYDLKTFKVDSSVPESNATIDENNNWDSDRPHNDIRSYRLAINGSELSEIDIAIMRIACSEWTEADWPVGLMHPSHKLANNIFLFDRPSQYLAVLEPKWVNFTSTQVLNALTRYVESHRQFACFDMAYAMLTQVLYRHKPRSAEALIWNKKPEVMNLGTAYSVRGVLPSLFAGTPYITNTSRVATYENWRRQPMRILVHSMALSEAVHCSTFDYVTRRRWVPEDRDEYKEPNILSSYVGAAHVRQCGLIKELTLAGLRFGKTFNAPWASQNGLVRYNWMDNNTFEIDPIDVTLLDPNGVAAYNLIANHEYNPEGQIIRTTYQMPFTHIPPCCYPVFSMEINKNNYYMNDLTLNAKLQWDRDLRKYTTENVHDAHRIMSGLRIAGYNAVVTRHSDGKMFTNWSANADGHYMPTFSKNYRKKELYMFDPASITSRRNKWVEMPLNGHEFEIKLDFEYNTFCIYNDSVRYTAVFDSFVTLEKPVGDYKIANVANKTNYTQYIVEQPDAIKDYEDFRVLMPDAQAVQAGQIGPNIQHQVIPLDDNLEGQND